MKIDFAGNRISHFAFRAQNGTIDKDIYIYKGCPHMEFIDLKDYRTYHSVKDATFREPSEEDLEFIKKYDSNSTVGVAVILGIFALVGVYAEFLIIKAAFEGSLGSGLSIAVSVIIAAFIFGLIFLLTRIIDKPVGVLKGTLIDAQKEKQTQDYERTTSSYFYSLTIMFESEKIVLQGISSSNLKAGDSVDWTFKIDTEVLLVKYQKGGWLTIPLK